MSDLRAQVRTPFRSSVKLIHPDFGFKLATTRDISDGGIYIYEDSGLLSIGMTIDVQLQDTPIEAPIVQMVVVRRDPEGYGLQFTQGDAS